ncbi:hypothetical protein SAMN04488121_103872 [Chitinophaga filiformis]|uniref:Uncharacterized protein n=1 Tax=Chitinophaga filiformis TaxID=104663 RepID=A0A1G7SHG5_CHIFI|nr:hypothetical protein SAMN04488121_103872 [Chitinophaga filiformis]
MIYTGNTERMEYVHLKQSVHTPPFLICLNEIVMMIDKRCVLQRSDFKDEHG